VNRSVVVVGAGVIGCAIARELGTRGVACTVVDDRGVAGGATHASAGMLAPYVEAHAGGPLLELAEASLARYPDWIAAVRRESGIDVEYDVPGTLEVATDTARADELRRASALHGHWIDAGVLRERYPDVGVSLGGRFTPEHGYVAATELANALAQAAGRHGVAFHAARVERVTPSEGGFRVATTRGDVHATTVVLAAGAWTSAIQGIRTPPVRPVRGQLLRLAWPGETLRTILWGPRCYVVPRRDRSILVGATVEEVGFDERTTAEGVRALLDAVCDLLPAARDASFIDARAGLRPATPDDLPVLGPDAHTPGLVHASGHYRNGVLLAPITASLIGDLIVDGRRDACLENFRVDRFD
jgi:glycine oxidase ThiO